MRTGKVNAVWERAPEENRPSTGDPDHVDDVKSYDPSNCVRTKKK